MTEKLLCLLHYKEKILTFIILKLGKFTLNKDKKGRKIVSWLLETHAYHGGDVLSVLYAATNLSGGQDVMDNEIV